MSQAQALSRRSAPFYMPAAQTDRAKEPRWPATIAILAVIALYFSLPEHLTLGPSWLGASTMLVVLVVTRLMNRAGRHQLDHAFGITLLVITTLAIIWSLGALISSLPGKKEVPLELLRSAVALWVSNILVFSGWYWRLDAGGPNLRDLRDRHEYGAFLFPQMTLPSTTPELQRWKPGFVDYLFLAFNTSTAFSPTDVPVLSQWAKLLMMIQSSVSLGTLAILAARAINIL